MPGPGEGRVEGADGAFVFIWGWGCPGGSAGKESACHVGDLGLIPGLGRSPGEGKGYPLQYSGLENPMARGAWRATVRGVAELGTTPSLRPLSPAEGGERRRRRVMGRVVPLSGAIKCA